MRGDAIVTWLINSTINSKEYLPFFSKKTTTKSEDS